MRNTLLQIKSTTSFPDRKSKQAATTNLSCRKLGEQTKNKTVTAAANAKQGSIAAFYQKNYSGKQREKDGWSRWHNDTDRYRTYESLPKNVQSYYSISQPQTLLPYLYKKEKREITSVKHPSNHRSNLAECNENGTGATMGIPF